MLDILLYVLICCVYDRVVHNLVYKFIRFVYSITVPVVISIG